jgi:uncharacterized phage protein (TIGR01671 family)
MAQELKFRVWDKIKKVFIDSENYSWGNRVGESGQLFIDLNGQLHIAVFPCGNGDNSADSVFDKIPNQDRYVIQQFTGLKDKDGKEIYEGDIIDFSFSYGHERDSTGDVYGYFEVIFQDCEFVMKGINKWEDELEILPLSYRQEKRDNFKVCGNIFENPDLIK